MCLLKRAALQLFKSFYLDIIEQTRGRALGMENQK